ncbi:MAG: KpsF/GutQ family sugar-phosphate isomerase [Proteobacteria bacterium]|nr:KpsF/GutQ family sugar-phosphate isomerase [Pseudomonadota bacterium]MBI3498498.1 KpsF/GutQ family sugar-phosphate isomerase [Pseudomonadota bacterium]
MRGSLLPKPQTHQDKTSPGLAAAGRVLKLEAGGLLALAGSLGAAFEAALNRLAQVAGRVVVTGMGKSGHVARKIAATLASTGTPALFVHPAEASHGDLGMIQSTDAVLALSNSGETPELSDLIAYTRRFAIPLVAVVGRAPSTIAEAADVVLVLPRAEEACPMGLAPTTSTTMMMGLGDAIAIALLERRGFSPEDFRVLHPGGRLGAKLLRVSDLMHLGQAMPLTGPATAMAEAILVMTEKRVGCVGIVEESGKLVGIITDGDLRRHMGPGFLDSRAEAVMTRQPKTVGPRTLAVEALRLMNSSERPFTCLFVVEGGRPVGVLNVHDLLRAGVA